MRSRVSWLSQHLVVDISERQLTQKMLINICCSSSGSQELLPADSTNADQVLRVVS